MLRHSPEFGERVRRELEARRLSFQEVARRARERGLSLSFGTVRSMALGAPAGSDLIVELAETLEDDGEERVLLANELLTLAGKRVGYVGARVGYGVALLCALGRAAPVG